MNTKSWGKAIGRSSDLIYEANLTQITLFLIVCTQDGVILQQDGSRCLVSIGTAVVFDWPKKDHKRRQLLVRVRNEVFYRLDAWRGHFTASLTHALEYFSSISPQQYNF